MPVVHLDYDSFPRAEQAAAGMEERTADPNLPGIAMAGDVVYTAQCGMGLRLQILYPLYQPYAHQPKRDYPCIVHIHGSAWKQQDVYRRIPALCDLAKRGYVIASVEYRPSTSAQFPAQIRDAKAAIRWLRRHAAEYNGDPEKIAVMGDSSGGHTALMVHLTQGVPYFSPETDTGVSDHTVGCLALYAPCDLETMEAYPTCMNHTGADSPEGILMGRRDLGQIPLEELRQASPLHWVDKCGHPGPVLLVHGDKDDTVPFMLSVEMFRALKAHALDARLCKVVNAGHGGVEFWSEEMIELYDGFFRGLFGR